MTPKPLTLVVLISGNGTNLQAIIDAIQQKKLNAKILAVISNQEKAFGLQRAENAKIPTHVIAHQQFASREAFDAALQQTIDRYSPQLICLAGFMRRLGKIFVNHFAHRIINIHPSLLPKYPGLNTHAKAIAACDEFHGATIHVVTEELDAGPILRQAKTRILANETPEQLQIRIQQLEHKVYPETLQALATGEIQL